MLFRELILLLFIHQIVGQYEGDQCVLRSDRSPGICKKSCPIANDMLRCRRTRPTICGFDGNQPIVCCPTNKVNLGNCGSSTAAPTKERISVTKCNEYRSCSDLRSKRQLPDGVHGIVGGTQTFIGEYPHMAAIGWEKIEEPGEYAWNCGGSLISALYIVTAAHCTHALDTSLVSPTPTIVRLGEHNLKSNDESKIQDISIASILNHPKYKPPNKYHDIALIRLSRPVVFTGTVRPICLWQTSNFPGSTAIATGWGKVGYLDDTSDTLQKVTINIIDKNTCANFYNNRKRKLPDGVINEQMCAGDLDGGKDTCQGDSGGPLQIRDKDALCAYHLIGVTSFGVGCGGKDSPAVYTRISSYVDWIESVVWPQ